MSEKYTRGPWKTEGEGIHAIIRGGDATIVAVRHRLPADVHEANARRIVACVNACEGVDTELLEIRPVPFSELREERDSLLKQRDVLLDALIKIMQWNSHPRNCGVEYGSNGVRDFYRDTAYNAIANIRGKA